MVESKVSGMHQKMKAKVEINMPPCMLWVSANGAEVPSLQESFGEGWLPLDYTSGGVGALMDRKARHIKFAFSLPYWIASDLVLNAGRASYAFEGISQGGTAFRMGLPDASLGVRFDLYMIRDGDKIVPAVVSGSSRGSRVWTDKIKGKSMIPEPDIN